jgi:hypothetical protein
MAELRILVIQLFLTGSLHPVSPEVLTYQSIAIALPKGRMKPIIRLNREAVAFKAVPLGLSNSPRRSVCPSAWRASSHTHQHQPQKPQRDPCR